MARKPFIVVVILVASLALTPSAGAMGVQRSLGLDGARVVAPPQPSGPSSPLIASPADCPGQDDLTAPTGVQVQVMRCLTDYARSQVGLAPLADASELDLSAGAKAADVLDCDSFSHFACGRDFTYWMRETGYLSSSCWHAGENLAWGTGAYGAVRSIFQAWLRSPTHRRNILGDYSQLGVSVRVGELAGQAGTRVWTQHFGSRCEAQPAGA